MANEDRLKRAADSAVTAELKRIDEERATWRAELEATLRRLNDRIDQANRQIDALRSLGESIPRDRAKELAYLTSPTAATRNKITREHILNLVVLDAEAQLFPERIAAFDREIESHTRDAREIETQLKELDANV